MIGNSKLIKAGVPKFQLGGGNSGWLQQPATCNRGHYIYIYINQPKTMHCYKLYAYTVREIPSKNAIDLYLVGGFSHPSEKYHRQNAFIFPK